MLLTFNVATRSIAVPVNLTDDSVYEEEEDFSGTLTLVSNSPRVTIAPVNAVATIVDDEGMQNTTYTLVFVLNYMLSQICFLPITHLHMQWLLQLKNFE